MRHIQKQWKYTLDSTLYHPLSLSQGIITWIEIVLLVPQKNEGSEPGISRQRKIFIFPKYRTASESQSLLADSKFWVCAGPPL